MPIAPNKWREARIHTTNYGQLVSELEAAGWEAWDAVSHQFNERYGLWEVEQSGDVAVIRLECKQPTWESLAGKFVTATIIDDEDPHKQLVYVDPENPTEDERYQRHVMHRISKDAAKAALIREVIPETKIERDPKDERGTITAARALNWGTRRKGEPLVRSPDDAELTKGEYIVGDDGKPVEITDRVKEEAESGRVVKIPKAPKI